jgi:hypothetical protein
MITGTGDRERGATATVGLVDNATGCTADLCSLDTGLCSNNNMPCGYSQVFSSTVQTAGVKNQQFTPVNSK